MRDSFKGSENSILRAAGFKLVYQTTLGTKKMILRNIADSTDEHVGDIQSCGILYRGSCGDDVTVQLGDIKSASDLSVT